MSTSATTSATATSANTGPLIAIGVPKDKADIVQNVHMFFAPRVWSVIHQTDHKEWRASNGDLIHTISEHRIILQVDKKGQTFPVGRVVTFEKVKDVDRLKQTFAELDTFIRADDKAQDELMAKVSLTFSPEAVESRRGPVVQYHVEKVAVIVPGECNIFVSTKVFDFVQCQESWTASNKVRFFMGNWNLEWSASYEKLYLPRAARGYVHKLPPTLIGPDFAKVKEALAELVAAVKAAEVVASEPGLPDLTGMIVL